jgi:FkbM family methyltransferase
MKTPNLLKSLFFRKNLSHPSTMLASVVKAEPTPKSEFLRLQKDLGYIPRYNATTLSFLNYDIEVVDCASFLAQVREIFIDEIYKFSSNSPSPVILDCGANVGTSCFYFNRLFPTSRIVAFEPDPTICQVLKKNLAKNQLASVEVIEKAVWTSDSGVTFAADGADGGSIFGRENQVLLPSVRLRDLLKKEFACVDMLKLDIEGAEVDVLLDCRNNLSNVKNLFVEYHSWSTQVQRLDELLNILRENDYRYHIAHVSPHKTPFINMGLTDNMDLQLNIFAYKNPSYFKKI